MDKKQPLISLKDLSVNYGDTIALKHITGDFNLNSLTALIGPNGGGKSTLLKTIQGYIKPVSGKIEINPSVKKSLSYLPQLNELDRTFPLIVEEVVGMGLWPQIGPFQKGNETHDEVINTALHEVGIHHLRNRLISELSGGQFQRMLFARIIVQDASLIILDEPFNGIDAHTAQKLLDLIQVWHRVGKTLIVVVHNLEYVHSYFPETLLVARHSLGWGSTKDILTDENMKKAFYEFCC